MQAQTPAPRIQGEAAAQKSLAPRKEGKKAGQDQASAEIRQQEKPAVGKRRDAAEVEAGNPGALFASFLAKAQAPDSKAQAPSRSKEKALLASLTGLGLKGRSSAKLQGGAAAEGDPAAPQATESAEGKLGKIDGKAKAIDALLEPSKAEALKSNEEATKEKAAVAGKMDPSGIEGSSAGDLAAVIPESMAAARTVPKEAAAMNGAAPPEDENSSGLVRNANAKAAKIEGDSSKVSVSDLRRKDPKSHDAKAGEVAATVSGQAPVPERVRDLEMDLSPNQAIGQGEGKRGFEAGKTPAELSQPSRDFASVLAEKLQDGGNSELVQSARIVLRDGDSGTIRLRLHPDSLGGVKIELQLADNSISGKIIVETDAAKNAFERNMAQLQDAFKQSGFDSARLEVQVGGGGQGNGEGRGGADGMAKPFWSERRGLESLAAAVPETGMMNQAGRQRSGVNILA